MERTGSQPAAAAGPSHAEHQRHHLWDNVWAGRTTNDGRDRSHVTPMSVKMLRLRIAQLVLAVVFLILAAFAANTLNLSTISGFGFAFFTFSWTVVYFAWLAITGLKYPVAYHWIAHITLEVLTNIFWLASWAVLASYASELDVAGLGRTPLVSVGRRQPTGPSSSPAVAAPGTLGVNTRNSIRAAEISIAVAAGIGAVIWVLFCVTLVMTIISVLRHREYRKGSGV